ncbi:MAG: hypothetical protein O7I93_02845 [Gemmatimonadetes bacterium]|nr:hypothetical protein [Gemmatimonadota bacterium]
MRSKWDEKNDAFTDGRPRRWNYELTAAGKQALATATERFALHRRLFEDEVARVDT